MRKICFLTTILLLFLAFSVKSQTSETAMRFQGFAYDPEGVPLKSEAVTVRFTLYPKTGAGFIFDEVQEIITDPYGVFYCNVGEVEFTDFQRLNFTAVGADYWMKIEVKKTVGGVYTTISDNEMLAVPYAKFADNGVPVGTIMPFGGQINKIPDGWLLCDGTEYDGADPLYEQLFNVIGATWGNSGGDAFNVPDLSGIFVRGQDANQGVDPDAATRIALNSDGNIGDKVGSYQADEVGPNTHTFSGSTNAAGFHAHNVAAYFGGDVTSSSDDIVVYNPDGSPAGYYGYTNSSGNHSHSLSGTTNNPTGATGDTRPENVYVAYIIKY